jgi:hypothetical protein
MKCWRARLIPVTLLLFAGAQASSGTKPGEMGIKLKDFMFLNRDQQPLQTEQQHL